MPLKVRLFIGVVTEKLGKVLFQAVFEHRTCFWPATFEQQLNDVNCEVVCFVRTFLGSSNGFDHLNHACRIFFDCGVSSAEEGPEICCNNIWLSPLAAFVDKLWWITRECAD